MLSFKAWKTLSMTVAGAIVAFTLISPKAEAAVITLDFEGVGNLQPVDDFYEDDFGITFSNALGLVDGDAGGTGNFGGEPSPDTAIFFLNTPAIMNVANGFINNLSLFYSSAVRPTSISIFDGLNGTGNLLATLQLPRTPFNGAPDPTGVFSPFVPTSVNFSGVAKSVDFGNAVNLVGFDNITVEEVPEPMTILGTLTAGAFGAQFMRKRKKMQANKSKA